MMIFVEIQNASYFSSQDCFNVNSFPDDKILDQSKVKQIVDDIS